MTAEPRIRLARPDVGEDELAVIKEVFASGMLTNGRKTDEFEATFAARHGAAHAIAVANGTLALSAIHIGLGIGPGDEVIVPSETFISTTTSVMHVGAEPVFAEVRADTFNLDAADVRRRLTARTKAIVAVHYGGQPADLDELCDVANEAGIPLIEDAAGAAGATYKARPVGGIGAAAMFSFTPTKNITMGEGGVITTNDAALADRLRLLRNHGQTALYRHEVLGWNWRITEMQAAMGLVQLDKLDGILRRKRVNAAWMASRLVGEQGITPPLALPDREHAYMLYTVVIDGERDEVMKRLQDQGIEARLYFPPAHLQPVFADRHVSLPVTEDLSRRMISLPFHAGLTDDELETVASALIEAVRATR